MTPVYACGVLRVGTKWSMIRATKGDPDDWEAVNGMFLDRASAQAAADKENAAMEVSADEAAQIIAGIHQAGV